MTEPLGDLEPKATPVDNSAQIAELQAQLNNANVRINKYDGERKDYAEQGNKITELTDANTALNQQIADAEFEETKDDSVTQEELKNFKAGEGERFAEYNKSIADKAVGEQAEYQQALGQASLSVKNEETFNAICKEHDALVASGGMPAPSGSNTVDAQLAWKEAENSHYRKMLALGKTVPFEADITKVNKPVVPGAVETGTATTTQTTTMPDLPDDAKQFLELMGDTNRPDFVNGALGK